MSEHIANRIIDSRARILAPLALFFAACFSLAGAIKFHVMGGDLWFVRPMGAPVTCVFLALVAWAAARWFCGVRPAALGSKLLATLVVLLPVMGLLGVIQAATRDPSLGEDPTPLGGTLGAMLAGPKAFGSLGATVAGITFGLMSLVGAYLARRITAPAASARAQDPRTVMKAMSAQRAAASAEPAGGVAVIDEEAPDEEEPAPRGDLFPADAELEPEPSAVVEDSVRPIAFIRLDPEFERDAEEEPAPEPVRMPILSGLVAQDEEAEQHEATPSAAHLFAASLRERSGTGEPETAIPLDLDLEDEGDDEPELPSEPEAATAPRAPSIEVDDEEVEDLDDGLEDEDEEVAVAWIPPIFAEASEEPDAVEASDQPEATEGEAPELRPEWLAAPAAFHVPRGIQHEIDLESALHDAPEATSVEAESAIEPEPIVVEETAAVAERPRFRVKAEYVRDEPVAAAPEVAIDAPAEPVASEEPSEAVEVASSAAEAQAVESQLEFPAESFDGAPASNEESAPARRPRRRMRSAAKDWATWDEQGGERPRLRLVKAEDEPERELEPAAGIEAVAEIAPEPEPVAATDDAYDRAVRLVVDEDRCSVSLLQRNLGVTFGEATALIDQMFQAGVVGPYQPTGRRDVLLGKKARTAAEEA